MLQCEACAEIFWTEKDGDRYFLIDKQIHTQSHMKAWLTSVGVSEYPTKLSSTSSSSFRVTTTYCQGRKHLIDIDYSVLTLG